MKENDICKVIKFLEHIGSDFSIDEADDYTDFHIECRGQGDKDSCPAHDNCGICRYEYMKRKGWLA